MSRVKVFQMHVKGHGQGQVLKIHGSIGMVLSWGTHKPIMKVLSLRKIRKYITRNLFEIIIHELWRHNAYSWVMMTSLCTDNKKKLLDICRQIRLKRDIKCYKYINCVKFGSYFYLFHTENVLHLQYTLAICHSDIASTWIHHEQLRT